jgi:hypothetical protein
MKMFSILSGAGLLLPILPGLLPAAPPPPEASPSAVLAVPMIYQEQDQWCWAASCEMILSFYGYPSRQCEMANWCFGQSSCCENVVWPDGTGDNCNRANYLFGYYRDMQDVLVHWGPIRGVGELNPLSWPRVQTESNVGRPFVIAFYWTTGGGHAMVGKGYSGDHVYYNDPWDGPGVALYSWLVESAEHVWDESYRLTAAPAPLQPYAGDFSGDGKAELAVFRPASGLWAVRGVTRAGFGQPGDIPVPADYNGNGRSEIAVFRPALGLWRIRGLTRFYFGRPGDLPLPLHHQGGAAPAVFRPASGLWAARGGDRLYFGRDGDIPVPGPYVTRDGLRGLPEPAVFRPATGLWAVRGLTRFYFGRSGDTPVPGAYTTDSTDAWRAAIFRPATGLWSVRGVTRAYFGRSGDTPVPGDYAGTWGDEIAIFRPATGLWAIRGVGNYYFGRSGDIPSTR